MTETSQIRLREFVSGERGPYTSLPADISKCLDYLAALQAELAAARKVNGAQVSQFVRSLNCHAEFCERDHAEEYRALLPSHSRKD